MTILNYKRPIGCKNSKFLNGSFCWPKKTLTILLALLVIVSNSLTAKEETKEASIRVKAMSQKPWLFLKNYEAKYKVTSKKKTLGHATRSLSKNDSEWILSSSAKVSKLFFTLRNNESSQFHINAADQLLPDRYYSRSKLTFKKARIMEQKFDWESNTETGVRNKKKWQLKHHKAVFDRISHVAQLRADLMTGKQLYSYPVSAKGRVTDYIYHIEKKESIKTKTGKLNTIKLVRNKSNGDRFIFWLCPEMNYFPIKIAQYEKGKPDVTLTLESFKYLAEKASKDPAKNSSKP